MRHAASQGRAGHPHPETSVAFVESGYYFVRQSTERGDCYLAQSAAFHSRTHKHADDLTFIWFDAGRQILVDAGRFGYIGKTEQGSPAWWDGFWYSDPRRMYCESTRAHNTVEIDSRNHQRRGAKPYGSAIRRWGKSSCGVHFCETEVKHYRSIRHARVLMMLPGRWLVVLDWLHDNLEQVHDYRQWFHLDPALSLERTETGYRVQAPDGAALLSIAGLLAGPTPGAPLRGEEREPIQGFYSASERAFEPNWAFAYGSNDQRTACFATLFSLGADVESDPSWSMSNASGRNIRLRWRVEGVVHTLTCARPRDGDIDVRYCETPQSRQPAES